MNPLLEELLGSNATLPDREEEILRRILNDNFLNLRAQELMVRATIPLVIEKLLPIERQALIKRIGCAPRPVGKASWGYRDLLNDTGKFFSASCPVCKQTAYIAVPRPAPGQYLTKAAVDLACEELQWFHCGHVDRPDPNFVATFRAEAMRLVA
jgi:hypothetical protein